MRDDGRFDHAYELDLRVLVLEQANSASKQDWSDMDLELVEQPGVEILLRDAGAAGDRDVLVAGARACLLQRRLDAVRDKREGRSPLFRHGLARVLRENEDGVMERRVVAPPGVAVGIVLPGALAAAEHPAAHDRGADAADVLRNDLGVPVVLAALHAVLLAPRTRFEHPLVQPLAVGAEWLLERLIRAGDVSIQGHRDVENDLRHRSSSFARSRVRPGREPKL